MLNVYKLLAIGTAAGLMLTGAGCIKDAPVYSGTVCLDLRHHNVAVYDMTVFRKAGGERSPGFVQDMTGAYDTTSYTGAKSSVCFEGLGLGRHHFAAVGYDELLRDSVLGALSLDLTVRERRIDTIMSVSEQH